MAIQFELYKTPRPKDEADKETYHARVVNFQHIIVYDELLIKRFELLVLVGQFLSVSFDKLHGEFDNGAFGYQVAVIIRVKSGVNRHEIIRHDTASAVNGTAEFLGLYFQ